MSKANDEAPEAKPTVADIELAEKVANGKNERSAKVRSSKLVSALEKSSKEVQTFCEKTEKSCQQPKNDTDCDTKRKKCVEMKQIIADATQAKTEADSKGFFVGCEKYVRNDHEHAKCVEGKIYTFTTTLSVLEGELKYVQDIINKNT